MRVELEHSFERIPKPTGYVKVKPEVFGNRVLGAYIFNEGSGPVTRDLATNRFATLFPNTPGDYSAMWQKNLLYGDIAADYAEGPGFDIGSSFSMVCRGLISTDGSVMVFNGTAAGNYSFMLYRDAGNTLRVYWNAGAGNLDSNVSIITMRNIGFSLKANGDLNFWVDDVEVTATSVSMPSNTHHLSMGRGASGLYDGRFILEYAYFFDGEITRDQYYELHRNPYGILQEESIEPLKLSSFIPGDDMATNPCNIAKGRVIEYYSRVKNNDPTNSALVIVVLKVSESISALRDYDDLSALLASAGNTEANFTNYARIELVDSDLAAVPAPDHTNNWITLDLPDQVWSSAGGTLDNTTAMVLVCYDSDTTSGTDTNIIPLAPFIYVNTTTGADLDLLFNSTGFYRSK